MTLSHRFEAIFSLCQLAHRVLSDHKLWLLSLACLVVIGFRLEVHEPSINESRFPDGERWGINFEPIEAMLWQSFSTTAALDVDDQTADVFQNIANAVLLQSPRYNEVRLQFLVEQSLPVSGEQVAELLALFLPYQQERNQWIVALRDAKPEVQREMLLQLKHDLLERQVHYFGEDLAQVLFATKNKATLFNINRQIILVDSNLTTVQKRDKLAQLAITQQHAVTVP